MNFVKIFDSENKQELFINLDNIISICKETQTIVTTTGHTFILTQESIDNILIEIGHAEEIY